MDPQKHQRLKELTEKLVQYNNEAYRQFVNKTSADGYETDFYGEVKPFADKVKDVADEWQTLILEWIREEKPKYVYPPQIHDTYDNIAITSVTAFQKSPRRKRFFNTINSIDHVLDTILKQM